MAVGLLVLEDDLVVGLQAQPVQALEDRGDGGSVERSRSVSSTRTRNFPPVWRAYNQLNSAVRAPPMCRKPVGDGAKRVTTPEAVVGGIGSSRSRLTDWRPMDAARTATDTSVGGAARLSTRLRARPSLGAVTASLIGEIDANRERWMLWSPVAFGLGAAGYLELRAEPSWALLVGLAAGLAILAALVGRRAAQGSGAGLSVFLVLATFLAAGALAGKVRSHAVAAPILAGERTVMTIDGFVVDVVSPGAGGPRLLIAPVQISRLAPRIRPSGCG
jgi:hypothetical protein